MLLTAAILVTALASGQAPETALVCQTVCTAAATPCVCPPAPKPVKKVVKKKAVQAPPAAPQTQKQEQHQQQSQQVIIQIITPAPVPAPAVAPKAEAPETSGGLGLRAAVGLRSCNPSVFALAGARFRIPRTPLGLDVNSQFYWGHSAQVMIYPLQGPLSWHLGAGALVFYHRSLTVQDVPRGWDMLAATGLEWTLLPHLSLTADLRMTFPNIFDMNRLAWPDSGGRQLNVGNVMGNSFMRSQFLLGFMIHSW